MTLPLINHIVEDMNVLAGGVPAVVRQLVGRLANNGHKTSVTYCIGDATDLNDIVATERCQPRGFLHPWSHSPDLINALLKPSLLFANKSCIYHIHGVWKAPQILAAKLCHDSSIPFLFSVHGMLEPWLWNCQGSLHKAKKQLFWNLLAKESMRKSSVIHAITPLEREHIHALLPGCRIELIPNAIDLDSIAPAEISSRAKRFLFLGRLEPKKGVDILIKAFALSKLGPDWSLDIVGPSWSDAYLAGLHGLVRSSNLSDRIHFHGPLLGVEKEALLQNSWAMVAPSHSEVVGLVNLEAAARLLPSITTYQTGLTDWLDGGGLLVSPDYDTLAAALIQSSLWSVDEQIDRGVASRMLVEKRYSWSAVMPMWESLYASLLY